MNKMYLITIGVLFIYQFSFGQNGVSVNTDGSAPNGSAILDVKSTNKGMLIPRVFLSGTNDASTISNPATSLLVYNQANAGSGATEVFPGFYYNSGTDVLPNWKRVTTGNSDAWVVGGNLGTTPGTHYIGTSDANDLVLKANSTEVIRLKQSGRVGIGLNNPSTKLEVYASSGDAIYGRSPNVGGYVGYESNINAGIGGTISGAGVYAINPSAAYGGVFGQSTGAATVAANVGYSTVWIGLYGMTENASNVYNPNGIYGHTQVTNSGLAGFQSAIYGYSGRGTTSGNPGFTIGVQGLADAQNQDAFGVMGTAYTDASVRAGGYFAAYTYAGASGIYAYVGGRVSGINRKIVGTGSVSEIIPTENHGRITLTCPESPEYWYQDYGSVALQNGFAHVNLDPILADIIFVDDDNPIRVFCTPVNMTHFNGVAIMNQTASGFDLVELNDGQHSGILHYQIVVKPKTNYGEGRFPQAPGPAYLKADKEPLAAKAKNQVDPMKVFHWKSDHEVYNYNPEDYIKPGDVVPAGPNAGKTYLGNGKYREGAPLNKSEIQAEK